MTICFHDGALFDDTTYCGDYTSNVNGFSFDREDVTCLECKALLWLNEEAPAEIYCRYEKMSLDPLTQISASDFINLHSKLILESLQLDNINISNFGGKQNDYCF